VIPVGSTGLGTAGNGEEWSTQEYLEGGVLYNLYLEVDRDWPKANRVIPDLSTSHRCTRVGGLQRDRAIWGQSLGAKYSVPAWDTASTF
jgi:hypothetical protein